MELFRKVSRLNVTLCRQIQTTRVCASVRWRKRHGLPINKTSSGPLTDLPDYSFLDGRVVPLGSHQKSRHLAQVGLAEKMVQYIGELDFAKNRRKNMIAEKNNKYKSLMEGKLKSKGLSAFEKKN